MLWYNIWVLLEQNVKVWNVKGLQITALGCIENRDWKIRVWGKWSFPSNYEVWDINKIELKKTQKTTNLYVSFLN